MKRGRPSACTPELIKEICEAIATSSNGLNKLCKENPHWPNKRTIMSWRISSTDFHHQYTRAKIHQIEAIIDDILDIADDTSHDTIIKIDKNGDEYEACNNEWIIRSRLRIDTRKWLASKLVPKVYGDKAVKEDNDNEQESNLKDLE